MSKVVKAVVGVALVVAGVLTGNFQLIIAGVSLVGGALFSPKGGKPRGAAVTTLQVGEVPRQGIVGRAATAGSLVDAFNYGGKYGTDWEVLVIALADHRCDALEGFYVNDTYVNFAGDGMVGGYNNQLSIWWRPGTESQTVPTVLTANGPGWTANDNGAGVSYAVVAYKADASDAKNPVWTNGRPRFLFVVRGALCYDPRKDSTASGVGAHRWLNPATWEWSQNTIVTRYKFARGFYACDRVTQPDQLLLGRGLSDVEAPTANLFHRANLCDEVVDGEPRYQVGGLFESTETYLDVENDFAAACAGTIVQPEGAVEIDPGEARAAVVTITDQDLVVGSKVKRRWFLGIADREWVNSVVANYIEPSQKWTQHAAPVRRDNADILADKGPREESLQLGFVSWAKQAGRVAEIVRRLGRLHIRAEIVLPPRFCELEEGDWIVWQSDRYLKGNAYTFRIEAWGSDRSWQHSVVLRQISASCYSDTALLTDGSVAVLQPPRDPIGAPSAANWALTAGHLDAGSIRTPALVVTGASNDPSARFIRMEYVQGAAAPNEATVWSDAGVTGPDIKRREIPVAAGGTYRVGISYIVDGTQGDRLILGPVIALAVTYPNGVPVENLQPVEPGATNDANLDDPTQLIINEKIRLIESEPKRINRKAQVRARMVALGLSITAIDAAELNWLAYRNALAPAWDSTASHSVVNRSTWNTLSQAFDAAIDLGDKAISEEDAKRAEWSTTYNRPVLLTGQGVTVDENLLDPTVWAQGSGTFSNAGNGDGWYSSSGVYASIYHSAVTATPIDPTASYEVSMDVIQDIAGQGTATFYCGVVLYDANGNNITGDGTFWHYFKANETTYFGSEWETTSARIGRGTAKPFPTNAVKFGLVCLLNYNNTATTCRVRRMRTKRITKSEMTAAMPHLWQLADGIAVRTAGNNAENWGHVAYENTFTAGPQKLTFKGHRPGTGGSGAACIIGLTDQAAITNYNDLDAAFYLDDVGAFYIYENGTLRYTGSAYPANTEYGIEYDGLRFRYYVAGDLIAYSSIPGPDKSFKLALDTYYRDTGAVGITHTSTKSTAIVGSNITDTTGNFLGEADLRNNQIGIVSGNFINPVGAGNNYEVGNEKLRVAVDTGGVGGRARARLFRADGGALVNEAQLPDIVQNIDQQWNQVSGAGRPEDYATVGAAWGSNLTGRPTELTDGRIPTGLDASGYNQVGIRNPNHALVSNTDLLGGISGTQLHENPELHGGAQNGFYGYDNSGGGKTLLSVVADNTAPNGSGYTLNITYDGTGTESVNPTPGWGGFTAALSDDGGVRRQGFYSRGTTLVHKLWVLIPAGRTIAFASNATGNEAIHEFLTPTNGTGSWQLIIFRQRIGITGTFGSTGVFFVYGGANTAFTWRVAKHEIYDITSPQRQFLGRGGLIDQNGNPLFNGNVRNEDLRVVEDAGGTGGRARLRLQYNGGGADAHIIQPSAALQNVDQRFDQVVPGYGKPEDYSTKGSNRVFNGDAATHTLAGWSKTYYQSNTFEISAQGEAIGGERSFALRKPASGVGGAVAVCKAIQVIPGQKLYARIKYYGSTTTANGIYFRIAEYNARPEPTYVDYLDFGGAVGGSVAGSSNTDMINNGPVSGAGVTAFEGPYTVPAGVYWVSVMVLNWTVGPATLIFDDVYLGESQSGADVTTLVTGGRSIKVAYDHTGAVKSGQLPIDVLIKMYDGNANVTTSTAWSASLLSGTATFTIGAATGVLNITALSTDATIDVVGVYGGKTRRSEVSLIRNIDIPPTGGYSASANVNGTVTTSYGSSSTGVMQVRTGANGSVSCSGVIDFVKTVVGTTGAYGKWQWRAVGGSFADIATEQASSVNAVRTGGSEPTSDPGSLSVGMTKGSLSANTIYEFQLLVRGASSSIEAGGAASLVGS